MIIVELRDPEVPIAVALGGSLTFCGTQTKNSQPMKKYILSLLGIFVAMAFIASCQQEGTTVTEEPAHGTTTYMNRPSPLPAR